MAKDEFRQTIAQLKREAKDDRSELLRMMFFGWRAVASGHYFWEEWVHVKARMRQRYSRVRALFNWKYNARWVLHEMLPTRFVHESEEQVRGEGRGKGRDAGAGPGGTARGEGGMCVNAGIPYTPQTPHPSRAPTVLPCCTILSVGHCNGLNWVRLA